VRQQAGKLPEVREIRGGFYAFWPRIPWSGKAATKGYWKCHGKKHTENTGKISSVFSVQNSVANNLCFYEKDLTVSNTKAPL
jgi:hypothetical protein